MKRRIILITLISLLLCSCSPAVNGDQTTVITPSETVIETAGTSADTETSSETETAAETEAAASAETSAETEADENTVSADTLRELMDGNLHCMIYIFSLSSLHYSGNPVEGEYIYKVDDEKFRTFDDLKNYLLTIYTSDYTDELLYNYPYENDPKYLNINGDLCINAAYDGGKGYYVNWDNAAIDITYSDSTSCKFTITGQLEEPAEEVIPEPYSVDAEAVYENGRWVLTKMIY